MKLVIINGAPRSGKDTFAEICCQIIGDNCKNISTIDCVKEVAMFCGWDGVTKDGNTRKFLSNLKDILTEWNDLPYRRTLARLEDFYTQSTDKENLLVFVHSREPEDIKRYKNEANAVSLLIRRPSVENQETTNHADADVFNYDYDYTIYNDKDIVDLIKKAKNFIKDLGITYKK